MACKKEITNPNQLRCLQRYNKDEGTRNEVYQLEFEFQYFGMG